MRLSALKLSQPTVFAYTFLLLIVMNLGPTLCNEKIVVLFHDKSSFYLTMHQDGTVNALPITGSLTPYQCLTMDNLPVVDGNFTITIYNHAANRFLCFNKFGRLVGKRKCSGLCKFKESMPKDFNGYMRYESARKGKEFIVAFTKNGKPSRNQNMANFMKTQPEYCTKLKNETYQTRRRHNRNKKCGKGQ